MSSGRAEVVKSRSVCGRPSIASRTGPPTSASSWPAVGEPRSELVDHRRDPLQLHAHVAAGARPRCGSAGAGADTRVNSRAGSPVRRAAGGLKTHRAAHYPLRMLRRLSISAALAALAVPVVATGLLAGPAAADADGGPTDPDVQTQVRKTERRARRAGTCGDPAGQADGAPSGDGRAARGHHRQAHPVDDPGAGRGPRLRARSPTTTRSLVDDQRPPVHLGRADDLGGRARRAPPRRRPTRSSASGSTTSGTRTSSRSSPRASRCRTGSASRAACSTLTAPASTGSASTRSARTATVATRPPTAGPAPSSRWSRPRERARSRRRW